MFLYKQNKTYLRIESQKRKLNHITVMRLSMMGMHSEKCVTVQFCYCVNLLVCIHMTLHSTAYYTAKQCGIYVIQPSAPGPRLNKTTQDQVKHKRTQLGKYKIYEAAASITQHVILQ